MKTLHQQTRDTIDESAESEITIHPDGRVFAFGITARLAAVLAKLPTSDLRMKRRLDRISRLGADSGSCAPSPFEELP
jgi:hypothetical protein